jgi:uncharacterized membrane protein (DUF485 family)
LVVYFRRVRLYDHSIFLGDKLMNLYTYRNKKVVTKKQVFKESANGLQVITTHETSLPLTGFYFKVLWIGGYLTDWLVTGIGGYLLVSRTLQGPFQAILVGLVIALVHVLNINIIEK